MVDGNAEFPYITEKNCTKRAKYEAKPLFKLKIKDVIDMPYYSESNVFKFRNHNVSLIMCGGTIKNIFRDDSVFWFEIQDDTGHIQCFYKNKHNADSLLHKMMSLHNTSYSIINPETSYFSSYLQDSVTENADHETNDLITDVIFWFKNNVVDKKEKKIKDIGDVIHVTGHLLENESIRKINVLDYRIVEIHEEHSDFKLEVDYLCNCVY